MGKSSYPVNQLKIAFERFFFLKNPFEPGSLINYRKSTDDCCFLLAKSDFSVSLIPCHNLHPVYLSRSPSVSLSLSFYVCECVWVCMWGQQTVHPILSGQATLDWGHPSLPAWARLTKTDLDQRWLQAGAQMTEAEGGWEGLEESLDGPCNAATIIMSLIKRTPGLPSLRGLLASSPALCWHNWANRALIWPPAGLGRGWKSPRHENAVVVDITVWLLECLWGTAVHSGEQRGSVGQLVSSAGNHLLSFVAFYFDLKAPMCVTWWNYKACLSSIQFLCLYFHPLQLNLSGQRSPAPSVSSLLSYSWHVKEGLYLRLEMLITTMLALCVCVGATHGGKIATCMLMWACRVFRVWVFPQRHSWISSCCLKSTALNSYITQSEQHLFTAHTG